MTKNKLSIAPPDKKKTLEAFFRYYVFITIEQPKLIRNIRV